ncbi:hypothetical protein CRUP_013944 [Coryphaenoides rupestris]|nr:hypothetical protein CRUP_013944 [Coryphaenoides rupestris]
MKIASFNVQKFGTSKVSDPDVLSILVKDLVLVPVHTKPQDSEKELDELHDVFHHMRAKWKTDNVMLLGDFNADGAYVTKKEMKGIRIRSDTNFHWLIGDDVDTTASTGNSHTYDRIVVYGQDMLDAVVPNSAKPFNFQKAYELTEQQALKVSDHYPVEVELKSCFETPTTPPIREGEDLLEMRRENLRLEREKLILEIAILRLQKAKLEESSGETP